VAGIQLRHPATVAGVPLSDALSLSQIKVAAGDDLILPVAVTLP
jgi:hypothetical protein